VALDSNRGNTEGGGILSLNVSCRVATRGGICYHERFSFLPIQDRGT